MPELPEVETIRRDLERGILQKTIGRIAIADPRVLRQPIKDFIKRLNGKRIESVTRRGKALLMGLSSTESWVIQVMMTGQMVLNAAPSAHTRASFTFTDGTKLLYNDQRVFGQLRVVKTPENIKYFGSLGPEPLEKYFTPAYIRSSLKKSKRAIKSVLLDHTFVAGIGNIYACEILFRCGISPKRRADRVKSMEAPVLREQTKIVLKAAIAQRGSSLRNYRDGAGQKGNFVKFLRVYGRAGEACVVCQSPIVRIVQFGRSTFYCPCCQR